MKGKTTPILVCLLIGLCFLWTGSGYLTWMHHLLNFYSSTQVDILTEVIGYIFQILGLAVTALYIRNKKINTSKSYIAPFIVMADFLFISLATLSNIGYVVLFFGYLMNLCHGLVAGVYLTYLATHVPPSNKGLVFGVGYGFGSIGSWLISLVGDGNFLKSDYVLIVYALLTFLSILLMYLLNKRQINIGLCPPSIASFGRLQIILTGIMIILLCGIINMVFYFPTEDLSNGVSLEFTRVFYAFSLVLAGFINDRSRKWGAVTCIALLGFPFALLVLSNITTSTSLLWIFSYFFLGFINVYRVIVFSDMAEKSRQLVYLAGMGLMFGRCGDVLGAYTGMKLKAFPLILVLTIAVIFMITILMFINIFHSLYMQIPKNDESEESILEKFEKQFQFSPREMEVFRLVLDGRSNTEIADKLYISDNTVKFHIKNLLKKTSCSNRAELVTLFRSKNL